MTNRRAYREDYVESRKLRVGLLCVGWPGRHEVGGAARYAWRFAESIQREVDLHIITSEGGTRLPGATMHFLANNGGRFDHYYRFPLRVRRLMRKLDLDVLHAFGDDWALPRTRPAWVRTFHGSSWSEARASRGLRRWNHYVLAILEHSVRVRCDVAIAVGPESEREFRTDHLIPPIVPSRAATSLAAASTTPSAIFVGTGAKGVRTRQRCRVGDRSTDRTARCRPGCRCPKLASRRSTPRWSV